MSIESLIIAIDGYSSTGKSSFAKKIAAKYGLTHLDSGALYRAVTLFAIENGFLKNGTLDLQALSYGLKRVKIHFETVNGKSATFISDRNVEDEIRSMEISSSVSIVAANKEIRDYVDSILHEYGKHGSVIMDGRDIGTTVFPNADIKIFMTADPEIRAKRRLAEMEAGGKKSTIEEVLTNLKERDWADSHRDVSPLVQAPDAIILDNTNMTFDDQMMWIDNILQDWK